MYPDQHFVLAGLAGLEVTNLEVEGGTGKSSFHL
jgi:hypothetical protein